MTSRRVVLLTNIIPPYRTQFLHTCKKVFSDFVVVRTASTEANRNWDRSELDLEGVVNLRALVIPRTWGRKGWFREPTYFHIPFDTMHVLRRLAPDTIIAGELGIRTLQALYYKRATRRPVRLIIHVDVAESTEVERGRVRGTLRRVLLRGADAIWVNGSSGARYTRTLVDDPDKHIFRIPYPVPDSYFASPEAVGREDDLTESTDRPLRLLFVGGNTKLKNLVGIVSSLNRTLDSCRLHPQIQLAVAGAGHEEIAMIAKNGLSNRLRLIPLGFVRYAHLPAVYRQHDALLHPSLADTWGLVVGEAMASGLPVIGSVRAQAVEEMVEDGVSGYTFDPYKESSMDAAVRRLLSTPRERLKQMGQLARVSAERLRVERVVESLARYV